MLNATAQSGNITLEKSDAGELTLKASSGNITGSVLTEKIFLAESSSGRINVPKSVSGGRCEITTGSGNIDLRISTAD